MKFSGKMCLIIILKVTKNQGFTLCSEDTIFKKPHGGEGGGVNQKNTFFMQIFRNSISSARESKSSKKTEILNSLPLWRLRQCISKKQISSQD